MFLLMGLCSGIAAFALFAGAVWSYFKQHSLMESRVPTTGTVVDLTSRVTSDSSIIVPIVEFSVPSGEKVRFTSEFGSRPASHQIGQSVNVRYDSADPQKAEIESGLTLWLAPVIYVFIGAIACCLSIMFLAFSVFINPSFSP